MRTRMWHHLAFVATLVAMVACEAGRPLTGPVGGNTLVASPADTTVARGGVPFVPRVAVNGKSTTNFFCRNLSAAVLAVSSACEISGKEIGQGQVETVSSVDGVTSDTITVRVVQGYGGGIALSQISPQAVTLLVGDTLHFNGCVVTNAGSTGVKWRSTATSIVAVDSATGKVQARAQGWAAVGCIALADTTLQRWAAVTVNTSGARLVLSPRPASVAVGQYLTLKATRYDAGGSIVSTGLCAWSSSNSSFYVSGTADTTRGYGNAVGASLVTAVCGGFTDTLTVNVLASSGFSITLAPNPASTVLGTDLQLTASCWSGSSATACPALTWTSFYPAVGTVNASGVFHPLSNGKTVVTACGNNVCSPADTVTVGTTGGSTALVWTEENGQRLYISAAGYTARNEQIVATMGIRGTLFGGWQTNFTNIGLPYDAQRNAWYLDTRNTAVDAAIRPKAGDGKCYRFSPVTDGNPGVFYKIQEHINMFGYPAGEPGTYVSTMSGGAVAPPLPAFKVQLTGGVLQFVSITPSGASQPSCQ